MKVLKVGTRGSQLALRQTNIVLNDLRQRCPDIDFRITVIKTTGDKIADVPLSKIGDKGLFVSEIENALLQGDIDLAVHSAKDMPSEMNDKLCIAAYPEREDPSDAFVSRSGCLCDVADGAKVGTSSIRRRAQLLHARPDIQVMDLRGNLDTRLRKLENGDYDAVILAAAGLKRLGWESWITELIPFEVCLPAAGQGALAIQCRRGDPAVDVVAKLDHSVTRACVEAERALLAEMHAGCQTPIATLAVGKNSGLELSACVADLTGDRAVRMVETGDISTPGDIGRHLAQKLLDSPASEILEEVRRSAELKGMGAA